MFGKITRILGRMRTAASLGLYARQETLSEAEQLLYMDTIRDHKERHHALFAYLSQKATSSGFEIYNQNLMWLDEAEFWDVWKGSPYWKMQRPDRKFVLWSMARNTRNIAGDTAECGVLDGASSYLICSARQATGSVMHHAFDSFEGLSAPCPEDTPSSPVAFHWAQGDLSTSQEEAQRKLRPFDNIRYYKGWIPTRFNEVATRRFSFVHIDVDLFQPTKDSLEFFYERLSPGGILLCDDYGYHTCPGARKAFDEFALRLADQTVVHLPTGQGYIVKRNPTLFEG
jgi:O-methyltransferase